MNGQISITEIEDTACKPVERNKRNKNIKANKISIKKIKKGEIRSIRKIKLYKALETSPNTSIIIINVNGPHH